ncbi:MAG: hypothetical protein ACLFRF_08210 [Desulfobacterales bacterium]
MRPVFTIPVNVAMRQCALIHPGDPLGHDPAFFPDIRFIPLSAKRLK